VAADPLLSLPSNLEFRDPFFGDLRPATFQQEAVAFSQSGCSRKGGLTCAACHDTHSGAPTAALAAADGGDALCASCHQATAALGTRHTLHPAGTSGGRCLDCHMAAIVRGPGSRAARDHTLAPPTAEPGKVPAACAACHVGAPNAAAVASAWKRVVEGPAARRRREIGTAVDGAETAAGLATLVQIAADSERGWFLRWAAIQRILAAATARRSDAMIAALRDALADPNPALRRAAARAIGRFGRTSDFEALERATGDPDPWTALAAAQALGTLGAPTAAVTLHELLQRPDLVADARAQYAYGHARLLARDWPRAEIALRRALEVNPMMVGAINDLGLCLMAEGRSDEAVAAWRRALELNPRFATARQNVEAATSAAPSKP
jgi:predicted CXXCH cytochrome family protein